MDWLPVYLMGSQILSGLPEDVEYNVCVRERIHAYTEDKYLDSTYKNFLVLRAIKV